MLNVFRTRIERGIKARKNYCISKEEVTNVCYVIQSIENVD
jgi:hypothetical protein